MNVYEAIAASPIGVAWHEVGKQTLCKHESCRWSDKNFPDGWQPLYTSPAEYTLGEPLTEAVKGQRWIAFSYDDGRIDQGVFWDGQCLIAGWRYYADPRPLPQKPEKKEEPKLFVDEFDGTFSLTAEGRRRLERLLRDVGWGQGEIDTATVVCEENEQLRAALRKLVDAAKSKEFDKRSNGGAWCSSCSSVDGWTIPKHAPVCHYAAAIAEAERLLGKEDA